MSQTTSTIPDDPHPDHGPHRPVLGQRVRLLAYASCCAAALFLAASPLRAAAAQDAGAEVETAEDPADFTAPADTVTVEAPAADSQIRRRLDEILTATAWFESLEVGVSEGIVTLSGVSADPDQRDWATEVARKLEGVVGVANRMTVVQPIDWSLAPAMDALRDLWGQTVRRLPLLAIGSLLVILSLIAGRLTARLTRPALAKRLDNKLLVQVWGTVVVLAFGLVGVYVFLQISGLSRLATTVLGGTGLFGLVVGVAFRDIAENFLASVLISAKRPFRLGDLIRIDDLEGYVQSVTTRGTLLMTVEGNYIHVPNSTVYKTTVINYSANPRRRFDFVIGIDYADEVEQAQAVCLEVLEAHDFVLDDPAPLVLVENLGASSVELRILYWVDADSKSPAKVQSSVLRQTKAAVTAAGLTMPDDAREVVFPQGVPVHQVDRPVAEAKPGGRARANARPSAESVSAEGSDESDSDLVRRQAASAEPLDTGEELVEGEPS